MSSLNLYLQEIKNYPTLPLDEQLALFRRYRNGDMVAYETLAGSNLKYVISVAKSYLKTGVPLEDLILAGNEGLVKAIQNYDPDKGYRFTTYAIWWIRQTILSSVGELINIIRLPTNRQNDLIKTKKKMEAQAQKLGRELTAHEIADLSDYDDYYPNHLNKLLSLNDLNETDHEYITNIQILDDTAFKDLEQEDLEVYINELLKNCSFKERDIITLYLGLGGVKPMTLEQIGKMYNLSRERIRQLRDLTIEKLKEKSKNHDS